MNTFGVTAFFQLDSLGFEELADVFIKLVFLYWIHNFDLILCGENRKSPHGQQLQSGC